MTLRELRERRSRLDASRDPSSRPTETSVTLDDAEHGRVVVALDQIERARTVFKWGGEAKPSPSRGKVSRFIDEQERLSMANFEFLEALGQIARDQNIDEGELLIALANALLAAYKRRPDSAEDAEVEINPETGEIKVWGLELDLEGNVTREWDATPEDFGRIAAQTAKQVLMQLIRDIQRRQMYEEFANREGDIVSGTVQQNDNRYTLLRPRPRRGAAAPGRADRLRALRARRADQGLHRRSAQDQQGSPDRRESHAPRAGRQALRDRGARDRQRHRRDQGAGARTGSPLQDRGGVERSHDRPRRRVRRRARQSRVRNITNELRSERIDVVPYSDDPIEFIQAALQPARVREVQLNEEEGIATVIVHDQQLSLAIGKEGQNARLAARLTGWRIDIRSENEGVEDEVVEEVWTDGDVVVDETVVRRARRGRRRSRPWSIDDVVTDAEGHVEEVDRRRGTWSSMDEPRRPTVARGRRRGGRGIAPVRTCVVCRRRRERRRAAAGPVEPTARGTSVEDPVGACGGAATRSARKALRVGHVARALRVAR